MKVVEVLREYTAEHLVVGARAIISDDVAERLFQTGHVRIVDDASDTADRVPLQTAASVTNLDGSPVERDADGMIAGRPLILTDEERARLPPLEPVSAEDAGEMVHGVGTGVEMNEIQPDADGVTRFTE